MGNIPVNYSKFGTVVKKEIYILEPRSLTVVNNC